jgi:hypothetical protein
VLENSCRADEHECPFGRTSVELVKLLCEVLRIGEAPSEQGQNYHPMFFTHDHPFEEFFCICIILLNKTWKEMRATTEDFVKVNCLCRSAECICYIVVPAGTASLFCCNPFIAVYLHMLIAAPEFMLHWSKPEF